MIWYDDRFGFSFYQLKFFFILFFLFTSHANRKIRADKTRRNTNKTNKQKKTIPRNAKF